jgi:uncharacterized protein YebE (UPF0316 family)
MRHFGCYKITFLPEREFLTVKKYTFIFVVVSVIEVIQMLMILLGVLKRMWWKERPWRMPR